MTAQPSTTRLRRKLRPAARILCVALILVASTPLTAGGLNVIVQPQGVSYSDLFDVLRDKKVDPSEAVTLAAKAISAGLSKVLEEGQICREAAKQWALHNKTTGGIDISYTVTVVAPPGESGADISFPASARVSITPGGKVLAVGVYKPGSKGFAKVYRCDYKGG